MTMKSSARAGDTLAKKLDSPAAGIRKITSKFMLEIILVLLAITMSIASPGFLTPYNLMNILKNMSLQGVIAFGMTIVIIAGEIDLSVGSTVGLTGVMTALITGWLSRSGIMPIESAVIVGILASITFAALIGYFNGFLLTRFRMPSFIITLAMLNVLYGIASVLSNGFPVITLPKWYSFFGAGEIWVIPVPAIILLLSFGAVFFLMNYTKFGRSTYAVGGNPEAARLSGINVKRVKIISMVVVQVCAAISGIMISSQVMSGTYSFGRQWEMTAIAAVIIGGASFSGGAGKVWGTFVGLIFLGIIINSMTLLNINEYVQYVIRGALILVAVLINVLQARKKA